MKTNENSRPPGGVPVFINKEDYGQIVTLQGGKEVGEL